MKRLASSEGARRLSLVLGWIGAAIGGLFGLVLIQLTLTGLTILLLFCVVGFVIPWGVVQIVSWVIEGLLLDHSGARDSRQERIAGSLEQLKSGQRKNPEREDRSMTTGYQGEHPITRLKILSLDGFLDGLQVAGGLGLLVSAGSGAFLILMGRAWFERTNQSHVSYDDMLWWCGMLVVGCLALSYVSMGAEYYRDHRNDLFGGLKQEGREFLAAVRLLGTREAWASWRQSWADLEKEGLGCLLFVVALFGIIGVVVVQVLPEKQPLVSHRLIVGILILMAAAGLWLASRGDRKN